MDKDATRIDAALELAIGFGGQGLGRYRPSKLERRVRVANERLSPQERGMEVRRRSAKGHRLVGGGWRCRVGKTKCLLGMQRLDGGREGDPLVLYGK